MAKVSTAKSTTKPVVHEDLSVTTPVTETPKAKAGRKSRDQLYAKYTPVREDVITLVPGGRAKTGKGLAIAKFGLYGDLSNGGSITVGEVLDKCKGESRATFAGKPLKPSIRWDWAHNLIQINGKSYVA